MSIRKIKKAWWIDFRYQGIRYRNKSPINTKYGAQAYETDIKSKLLRGEPLKALKTPSEVTFKDFSDIWFSKHVKTNNSYSEILGKRSNLDFNLIPYFGRMKLSEISSQTIEEYKAFKVGKIAKKTLKNQLSILSTCLNCAVDWEYLDKAPRIRMPKIPQSGFRWLSEQEAELLLNAANGMWHDMIFLALKTGLRFGELIALKWSDFDFDNRKLTINKSIVRDRLGPTKSGRIRYLPLTESVYRHFESIDKKGGLVFKDKEGKHIKFKKAHDELEKIYKLAGIEKLGWHSLRHTFASRLASNNISIQTIKELLGHATIQTTMIYSHLCPSVTTEAIKVLG